MGRPLFPDDFAEQPRRISEAEKLNVSGITGLSSVRFGLTGMVGSRHLVLIPGKGSRICG